MREAIEGRPRVNAESVSLSFTIVYCWRDGVAVVTQPVNEFTEKLDNHRRKAG